MTKSYSGDILIVDDVAANIALLTKILESKGHQILAANEGERAIKIAEHLLPDLILLDVMMSGIDGYETCRQLKQNENTQDIPIIFVTAKIEIDDLLKGFSVGGVDYIQKPFHEEEVCARVRSQMKIQILNKELVSSKQNISNLALRYRNQSKRLEKIVNHVVDGILEINSLGAIQFANPAVEHLFGYTTEQLQTISFSELLAEPFASQYKVLFEYDHPVHKRDSYLSREKIVEIVGKKQNGNFFPIDFSLMRITGSKETYLAVIHDIEIHKEKEEALRHLSYRDPLTNLSNRRRFNECFAEEWMRGRRNKDSIACIMIDIDYFKQFNDTYGHQAGDACLIEVANAIIKSIKRPTDIVARVGGEEFAIVLPETPEFGAIQIAQKVGDNIQALKISHSGSDFGVVTASLGVAVTTIDEQCHSPEALYLAADKALYQAKQSGRNQFAVTKMMQAFNVEKPLVKS